MAMRHREKTGRAGWRKESGWLAIAVSSGLLLSLLYRHFDRFPTVNPVALMLTSCSGFYFLSILVRARNLRGRTTAGQRAALPDRYLKILFPVLGFALGLVFFFF
jgi:hypothetical protein